jgi:hypothetical protein
MESAATLMGLGLPGALAQALGDTQSTIAGTGTAQTGGAAIGATVTFVSATTASSQTAFVLPAGAAPGHTVKVNNSSTTTALVYPDVGGTIDGGSPNASVSIATKVTRNFTKTASLTWVSQLTA